MTTVRQLLDQKGKNTRKGSTGRNANDHAAAGFPGRKRSKAVHVLALWPPTAFQWSRSRFADARHSK